MGTSQSARRASHPLLPSANTGCWTEGLSSCSVRRRYDWSKAGGLKRRSCPQGHRTLFGDICGCRDWGCPLVSSGWGPEMPLSTPQCPRAAPHRMTGPDVNCAEGTLTSVCTLGCNAQHPWEPGIARHVTLLGLPCRTASHSPSVAQAELCPKRALWAVVSSPAVGHMVPS